jgi:dTDP-4-amino-4,6-dideoxygalactose transaminase
MDLARHHEPLADELREAFDRVLGASSFILGEEVERFEGEFADYCGVRHCVGVGSGTAALILMLQGAGIGPGDEVIVPAHTFIATALSVIHVGATPVCADVLPATGLLDPAAARAAIGPATAAILPVHLYGQPCAMNELTELAERHGLVLFEDAAQAHGATHGDVRAGALGRAGAFSFYPSKNLGALGDGGAICTNDSELAGSARRLRDLGRGPGAEHQTLGYNERLDALQAALLRVKLPHLDRWNAARRAIAARYRNGLAGQLELLDEAPGATCVFHLFPVRTADRGALADALAERGIATGIHYSRSLPDQPALSGIAGSEAPVARDWSNRELSLPMFPEMAERELEQVVEGIAQST